MERGFAWHPMYHRAVAAASLRACEIAHLCVEAHVALRSTPGGRTIRLTARPAARHGLDTLDEHIVDDAPRSEAHA